MLDITPLIAIIQNRFVNSHKSLVKLMLDHGADPNLCENNSDDKSPLMIACIFHRVEIIDLLIDAGANINHCLKWSSMDALSIVVNNKSSDIFINSQILQITQNLVQRGANINHVSRNGTPLMGACRNNNTPLIKLLIDGGANINYSGDEICLALRELLEQSHKNDEDVKINIQNIKLLIDHGARTDGPIESILRSCRNVEQVLFLYDNGVKIDLNQYVKLIYDTCQCFLLVAFSVLYKHSTVEEIQKITPIHEERKRGISNVYYIMCKFIDKGGDMELLYSMNMTNRKKMAIIRQMAKYYNFDLKSRCKTRKICKMIPHAYILFRDIPGHMGSIYQEIQFKRKNGVNLYVNYKLQFLFGNEDIPSELFSQ